LLKIQNQNISSNYNREISDLEKQYQVLQVNINKYIEEHAITHDIISNVRQYVDTKMNPKHESGFIIKPNKQQIAKIKAIETIAKTHTQYTELIMNSAKLQQNINAVTKDRKCIDQYKSDKFSMIALFLKTMGYITETGNITNYGIMCTLINECNPFILTEIFTGDILQSLNPKQIICFLSILTDEITKTNKFDHSLNTIPIDPVIKDAIIYIESRIYEYQDTESQLGIFPEPGYWNISYDYLEISYLWASMDLGHEDHSKILSHLDLMEEYEGSFIKNMLKINNIVGNLMSLCELTQQFDSMPILQEIESLILKGMVNVNSIHVQS
jgi:superfamily II RNA helicase